MGAIPTWETRVLLKWAARANGTSANWPRAAWSSAVLIGFSTYTGTVSRVQLGRPGRAKESWPGNARRLGGAVSQRGVPAFLLTLPHDTTDSKGLAEPMSEREPELSSHYVRCRLHVCHRAQYDPFPIYQGAQQSTVLGKVASFNDFRLGAPKANFRRDGPRRYRMTASYQADLDSGATARCDGPGDLWSGWFGNSQKTQEFQVLFDFAG